MQQKKLAFVHSLPAGETGEFISIVTQLQGQSLSHWGLLAI